MQAHIGGGEGKRVADGGGEGEESAPPREDLVVAGLDDLERWVGRGRCVTKDKGRVVPPRVTITTGGGGRMGHGRGGLARR